MHKKNNDKLSALILEEQYTFKIQKNNEILFLQFTYKKSDATDLSKKYDLFSNYETISFEDLNSFNEQQFENVFTNAKNIYIVENFLNKNYVTPKLVKITSDINDFIKDNDKKELLNKLSANLCKFSRTLNENPNYKLRVFHNAILYDKYRRDWLA